MSDTLYVINDGDKYMVSKLPFDGYTKYKKQTEGCWVPSGDVAIVDGGKSRSNKKCKKSKSYKCRRYI